MFQALIFVAVGLFICFAGMTAVKILSPKRPSADKLTVYECGELPIGPGQHRLNFRFYTIALLFIIFDVEIVAILPTATIYKRMVAAGYGKLAFAEIFLFVGILALGLVYAWRKGDLDWFKDLPEESSQ
jgi:NADH-quinone oxidoreductase subunit A